MIGHLCFRGAWLVVSSGFQSSWASDTCGYKKSAPVPGRIVCRVLEGAGHTTGPHGRQAVVVVVVVIAALM
jgi:hypothetical protein